MEYYIINRSLKNMFAGCAIVLTTFVAGCDQGEKRNMELSVRFVDTQQVLIKSGLADQEKVHLTTVSQALRKGFRLAEMQYDALPEDKRKAAKLSDARLLETHWQQEQYRANAAVTETMQKVIRSWQSENKVSMILPRQYSLAIDESLDITSEIVNQLKNEKVQFGKLPEISVRNDEDNNVRPGKEQ